MKLFWNEAHNFLALVAEIPGRLPEFYIVDEEYKDVNPFFSYPITFLDRYNWVEIGNIP